MAPVSAPDRRTLVALALVAAGALLYEVTLVRLLSVALWYPFAFAALSTAMLGFGAAAVVLGLSERLRRARVDALLAVAALGVALTTAVGYPVWNVLPVDPMSLGNDRSQLVWLPLLLVLITLPFFAAGLFIARVFAAWPTFAPRLYAADLGGAAIGVLTYVVLLPQLGGPGTLFVAAALGGLAALCMTPDNLTMRVALATLVAALLGTATQIEKVVPLRVTENKLLGSRQAKELPRGSVWTLSSAIDVIEPSKTADPIIVIDGGTALSWVPRSPRDRSLPSASGLRALAYKLGPGRSTLVIGSGGGVEVQAALAAGSTRVLALEIDPAVNDLVRGRLNNILGGLFLRPEVELKTAEARAYLAASDERFDAIVAFHTISNAASSTGAMSLAESYLLTVEALRLLCNRLSDDGVLVISRPEPQLGRLLATLATAWPFEADLEGHVAVVTHNHVRPDFMAALVVTRRPMSVDNMDAIRAVAPGRVAYLPDGSGDTQAFLGAALRFALDGAGAARVAAASLPFRPATLTPVTDDRPFFNLYRPWHEITGEDIAAVLSSGERSRDRLEDLPVGQVAVLLLLAEATLLAALFLLPPWVALRRRAVPRRRTVSVALYFAALGFSYITVEIVLIQTLTRVLGEPALSMVAVLSVLLAASGGGSLLFADRLRLSPTRAALGAMLAALSVSLIVPWVASSVAGSPLPTRIITAVVMVVPIGMLMGVPFSAAMRHLEREDLVAWAWALNSLLSVAGSIGALILGSAFGFAWVAAIAALSYAGAAILGRSFGAVSTADSC